MLKRWITRIHLWTGLLLGLQVFLWMLSGFIMSWYPLDYVRGETMMARRTPAPLSPDFDYAGVSKLWTDGALGEISRITIENRMNKPVYAVTADGQEILIDAATGSVVAPLNAQEAQSVAQADFLGDADTQSVTRLNARNFEYRGDLPAWRVVFEDKDETHLYVSEKTGRITARRNSTWRLYDFFWMLHIMDYEGREDFNNPLLQSAAATGTIFAASGLVLVLFRIRIRRYEFEVRRLINFAKRKNG